MRSKSGRTDFRPSSEKSDLILTWARFLGTSDRLSTAAEGGLNLPVFNLTDGS